MEKLVGILKYWNYQRGFGFVNRVVDGNLFRYFLHISQILDAVEPNIGDTVKFHSGQSAKGLEARSAKIVPNDAALKLVEATLDGGK